MPKDKLSSLSDLRRVHSEADLVRMLSLETHAVLFKLLESLALTFTHLFSAILGLVHENEWLKTEFNSDGHEIRVLCYFLLVVHDIDELRFFVVHQL